MADFVRKPPHYFRYKIEPITFIMQNEVPYAEANAIKYLMRWRYKHDTKEQQLQDLQLLLSPRRLRHPPRGLLQQIWVL